jgi:hypothetical protein
MKLGPMDVLLSKNTQAYNQVAHEAIVGTRDPNRADVRTRSQLESKEQIGLWKLVLAERR